MNTLSLLIYFAGVVGNIINVLTLTVCIMILATVGSIAFWVVYHDETDSSYRRYTGDALEECRKTRELWRKRTLKFATAAFVIGAVNSFIPSRSTILLIASSEMGEKVLNHPKVEQVVDPSIDLITTWMKNETAEIKKKMEGAK